jgi:hypothetical protein
LGLLRVKLIDAHPETILFDEVEDTAQHWGHPMVESKAVQRIPELPVSRRHRPGVNGVKAGPRVIRT